MFRRFSGRGGLDTGRAWAHGPFKGPVNRDLSDTSVILRDVLQRSKDELNQTVRTRWTICLSTTRPGTGPGDGANVTSQCRLSIEGLVGLRQVVGEEGGHRQLNHVLELSFQVPNRLREIPRDPAGRREERPRAGGEFLPQIADVLQGDGDHPIPEEVTRLRHPDSPRDRAVLRREEELPHDEPVQSVHLELHPGDLLDVSFRIAGDDAERQLLHPRSEIMQTSEEPVDREPRRLDEVLDRDELGALVDNREAGQAAHRLVNLLQLARGELLTTPQPDGVATDDVVAGDHPRQRLGPAPFVGVDRRLCGDRIFLERPDPHAETPAAFNRAADQGAGPDATRRRPVFREGDPETRVSQLLDLPGFQLHDPSKYRTPPNTYAVRPVAASSSMRWRPAIDRNLRIGRRSGLPLESAPKPHESRRNRTEANGPPGGRPRRGRGSDRKHRCQVRGPRRGRRPHD